MNKLRSRPSPQGWDTDLTGKDMVLAHWMIKMFSGLPRKPGPQLPGKQETPSQGSGGPQLVCGHEEGGRQASAAQFRAGQHKAWGMKCLHQAIARAKNRTNTFFESKSEIKTFPDKQKQR